jgi:hypothetical protein
MDSRLRKKSIYYFIILLVSLFCTSIKPLTLTNNNAVCIYQVELRRNAGKLICADNLISLITTESSKFTFLHITSDRSEELKFFIRQSVLNN